MKTVACAHSYWTGLAQCYALLGPPLKPSAEDIGVMEQAVAQATAPGSRNLEALLLGVTPDIVQMRWPDAYRLFAVDGSWPMVDALWPRPAVDRRYAICANWLAMPFRRGSCDVVIGDGSLICMGPGALPSMVERLRELMKPGGSLILRCYLQPAIQEHPDDVFEDLSQGNIPSFHHFKLRLLMSMQRQQRGVAVSDVYERWRRHRVHKAGLPRGPGWEAPVIEMIEHYRDSDTIYYFPTLAELRSVFSDLFDEVALSSPTGYMGERCPIVVLRARSAVWARARALAHER